MTYTLAGQIGSLLMIQIGECGTDVGFEGKALSFVVESDLLGFAVSHTRAHARTHTHTRTHTDKSQTKCVFIDLFTST